MNNGYSVLWFLIYYLTGAYFGKFQKEFNGIIKIIHNIIGILVFYFSTILCFYFSNYSIDNIKGFLKLKIISILKQLFILRTSSVPMISQSISISLLLTQMNYNRYFAKIITFLGPFTFGIYLIHTNPVVLENVIRKLFVNES
jgi:hypothetical protein